MAYRKQVLTILLLWMGGSVALSAVPQQASDVLFEQRYGELLAHYWRPSVTINGIRTSVLDYEGITKDAKSADSPFQKTLSALERVDPSDLQDTNRTKAFWLNAYNFAAIRLVVDHYPINSIRSLKISLIKYPWSKKAIRIGENSYSLRQIEKDILLKNYGDPRIIFAASCAAVSCPDLIPDPFTASQLDKQLDTLIRTFFRNPAKGALLERENATLWLSWILDKDSYLFAALKDGILGFVSQYIDEADRRWIETHKVGLRYFKHDWTLNDLAQADRQQ